MKKIATILSGITLILSLSSAHCNRNKKCSDDVICTMNVVSVTVQVTDVAGNPVMLDEAYTTRPSRDEKIVMEQNLQNGYYVVLADNYVKKLANATDQFYFIGIKDGKKVVQEPYLISADCCHIKKQSGREAVKIN